MENKRWFVTLLLLVLVFPLLTVWTEAQDVSVPVSTPEQIKDDFVRVPCKNEERLGAVRSLLEREGALPSDLAIEKYKNVENLVVIKKGESSEKIVIGAHYDKVGDGCGAVDNWTGIVTLAHLYGTLKDLRLKKTLVFVAFGKEETGLIGSRAMMDGIDKVQAAEYCAMINIDSLGLGFPQVDDKISSKKLSQFTTDLATEMKMQFGRSILAGAESDSISFLAKKIPAVTIHGLNNEWPTILHSFRDQASKINPMSVYLGYRLVLAMTARLDQSPCAAYR